MSDKKVKSIKQGKKMGRKTIEDHKQQIQFYARASTFDLFGGKEAATEWMKQAYDTRVAELIFEKQEEIRRRENPIIITDLTYPTKDDKRSNF